MTRTGFLVSDDIYAVVRVTNKSHARRRYLQRFVKRVFEALI
jgi:hypothetical protein